MAARKPCRRCRRIRLTGFVLVVLLLLGYGLLQGVGG